MNTMSNIKNRRTTDSINGSYDRRKKNEFSWEGTDHTSSMLNFCYKLCTTTMVVLILLMGLLLIL